MNAFYEELLGDTNYNLKELEKAPWIEFIGIVDNVISNRIKRNKKNRHGR